MGGEDDFSLLSDVFPTAFQVTEARLGAGKTVAGRSLRLEGFTEGRNKSAGSIGGTPYVRAPNAGVRSEQSDPFSRGAYSYGAVGADGAQKELGSPLENVLFFAGEATDTTGHNGTVQGAIASGQRAAQEIRSSFS
jgi:hypothetical protein